jgi:hypothetical protein
VAVLADQATVAQALTLGGAGGKSYAVGGSISVTVVADTTRAWIGRFDDESTAGDTKVTAGASVRVKATNAASLGSIAGQLSVSPSGAAAVGASVGVLVVSNSTEARIDGAARVEAGWRGLGLETRVEQLGGRA